MNILRKHPALSSGAIFGLFILLSVLVHALFLSIQQPADTAPATQKFSPINITLKPQPQTAPQATKSAQASKHSQTQVVASKSARANQQSTKTAPVPIVTAKSHNTEQPKTISGTAGDGILIQMDALHWLQQQANSSVNSNLQLQHSLGLGQRAAVSDHVISSYRSEPDKINMVFNTSFGKVCATVREANPLDSFDQSVWMVNSTCNG